MRMPQCRSSGVKTANAAIFAGQVRLISIHAVLTGTKPTTIKVFDNASAASGTELARMIVAQTDPADPAARTGPEMAEFDMHGVLAVNGLYLSISSGTGEGAAVSVEFN
tara:strand:- start:897 stop:1223 length:327 start_codon:yes stop_codon:yes gene_type:complete